MKFFDLTKGDSELVKEADELIKKRLSKNSTVAAVLRTKNGKIFRGVNIDVGSSPCSICAEYAAIGTMVSEGEREIETIVAVARHPDWHGLLPPCGKCREFIKEFGNPFVIVEEKGKLKKARLGELLPIPYISNMEGKK